MRGQRNRTVLPNFNALRHYLMSILRHDSVIRMTSFGSRDFARSRARCSVGSSNITVTFLPMDASCIMAQIIAMYPKCCRLLVESAWLYIAQKPTVYTDSEAKFWKQSMS